MKLTILCILLLFLVRLDLHAQLPSLLEEIKQDSAVDLYLTLDWKNIEKHKNDKIYVPASLAFHTLAGDSMSLTLKARTRGHMRLGICSFPPIKLKFEKGELARHSLSSLNEVDLVHHCHEGDQYDQFLLREYMAYKLYELISPYSFHVQLVRVHYLDTDGAEAHETSYAFLIENAEELVTRINAKLNKNTIISKNAIDKEHFLKVCLFEFMIGNTDWYIPTRHNLEFIGVPDHKLLIAVPFDFDYSGLVSTSYAIPHETLKLPSVEMRYYQGWCQTPEEVTCALKVFIDHKQDFLEMSHHIQGFNERSVKHVNGYLEDFFSIIENPKKLENQIVRHCDMWPVN
jgi:hypothetical protein